MYELRPYQEEAEKAVLSEWDKGNKKTLLVLPTGTGKTIVFSAIAEEQVEKGHRVLIAAHREELLSQASDKLYKANGIETSLEKAEHSCLNDPAPVVVGSIQTLGKESRLEKFPHDYFQDIIVDEAHHCLSQTYQTMLNYFPNANVLGVTATPDRGDMQNLGTYFDSRAYEYSMRDAVNDGYLCPIKAQMIPLKLDLTKVRTTAGDYNDADLGDALDPYLEQIAEEMKADCQGRKTLVFLPLIATSQKFCRILNEKGMNAAEVNGNSPDRAEILADFESGKYDVLCNSMLLTEGWDCPSVDCIVVLRPTKIRSLYVQMVGRGTRTCPGKENLLLLDFLWLTTKHNLCRPSALIAKNEDQTSRIDKQIEEGSEVDLLEAAEKAEQDKIQEEKQKAEERQRALVKGLRANEGKKRTVIDPLSIAPYVNPEMIDYQPNFRWELEPATEKQLMTLQNMGIDTSNITTKGEASEWISRLKERQAMGLATVQQVNKLKQFGYANAEEFSFEKANALISAIAKNNWKRPRRSA